MGDNEQFQSQKPNDFLSPASFIRAAKAAHPAFRFALAIAGILAIVTTFARFGTSYATLILGAIAIIALMALFLVFAQAAKLAKATLDLPAKVLVWSFLLIGIAASLGLVSSVFFNEPLPFRDFIVEQLPKKKDSAANPSQPSLGPKSLMSGNKAVIAAELSEAYLATGRLLAFFDNWGQTSTRPTLRVSHGLLTGTSLDGRTVSTSVDPRQLPTPQHTSEISKLGGQDAESAVLFFSAYDRFRGALVALNSNPDNFLAAFTNATEAARMATVRGHQALCQMGITPPRMFPAGGFLEPMPPNCFPGPLGT